MLIRVHAAMQHAPNADRCILNGVVDQMLPDHVRSVSRSNLIARSAQIRIVLQTLQRFTDLTQVFVGLSLTPLVIGVFPDGYQVSFRAWPFNQLIHSTPFPASLSG